MDFPPPDPRTNRTLPTAVDPDNEDAITSANAIPDDHNTGNEVTFDADGVARAESTKRLLENPSREGLTIDTTPSPYNGQLHAIVGQHLVLTPTSSMQSTDQSRSYSPSAPTAVSADHGHFQHGESSDPATDVSGNNLGHFDQPSYTTLTPERIGPMDTEPEKNGSSSIPDSSSYFNLLGADVSNDVYKWHEKEQRRQIDRAQTYHAPTTDDPDISNIKVPGGFRRHFVQQDAATRGAPAPHLTESFIHFLGLFNMYEIDHFAGENFHSIPRRSIVVPKDLEKRRHSLAETVKSERKIFIPGQTVEEDEIVIEEPEEKISFSKAVGMLFKTFIASGILFLPNAFRNGGILFSPLFMTLIAVLCLHSFLLLVKCRELHPGSYGDIGQRFYGRWMRYIVLFAIAISQFGFCCGYCIFFAQQFAIVVDSLGGAHLDKIVWIAIFFVILVPFTLVRNIGKLGFSTLVADVCIIVGLIYLYVYDIKQLVINHGSPMPLRLFNSQDFGLFIGTAVFSFEGIGMVIPICGSMANPKQFPRALIIVLSVVCVLLVSFGAMGYAAYGDQVQTIVLDDLPNATSGEQTGKNAIQLLYIIAIFLTTPLMLFPCIRIIEHVVFRAVGDTSTGKSRILKENIVRVLVDFCVAIVAYAGYSKLDIFIAFVGSFACAPLLFIFPPLFHLRAFPGQPLWRKISDIVLVLFGFLVFFYTLVITIQSFSNSGH
ncbi:neutral amino acid transporter [Mortierella polycephala]|uniref:Neutral amino acid transporter n=1 Tax=Mortierella polycephala TaxID=41804 RepID=A0A9P6UAZ4_9FUNG|nr:neutral amino acid transporter [Mortierella polycephala]